MRLARALDPHYLAPPHHRPHLDLRSRLHLSLELRLGRRRALRDLEGLQVHQLHARRGGGDHLRRPLVYHRHLYVGVDRPNHRLLRAGEYRDSREPDLRASVLPWLALLYFDDLARLSVDDDIAALLQTAQVGWSTQALCPRVFATR